MNWHALALLIALAATCAGADELDGLDPRAEVVITLQDGTRLEGTVTIGENPRFATVHTADGDVRIWRSMIRSVESPGGAPVRRTAPAAPEPRAPPTEPRAVPRRSAAPVRQPITTPTNVRPPVSGPRVARQMLAGVFGGAISAVGGGAAGLLIAGNSGSLESTIQTTVAFAGAGYWLGAATCVYWAGDADEVTGSYATTLAAAGASIVLGALLLDATSGSTPAVAFLALAPTAAATLAFNLTRRWKDPRAHTSAFLNIRDGEIEIAPPVVAMRATREGQRMHYVTLFEHHF